MQSFPFRRKLRVLSCALLVLFLMDAQAQFNHAYHKSNDIAIDLIYLNGNFYGITQEELYSWKADGELRFVKDLNAWSNTYASDIGATADGNLIVTGKATGCDVWTEQKFLMKISTSGNEIFKTLYFGKSYSFENRVIESSNGDFYVSRDNEIIKFTAAGTKQNFVHAQLTGIVSGFALPDTTLMLSCLNQNDSSLVIMASDGTLLKSAPAPLAREIKRTSSGSFILFGIDGSIYRFGHTLVPAGSFSYSAPVVSGTIHNDTVFAFTSDHTYIVMDTALNIIHSAHQDLSPFVPGPVATDGRNMVFLTNVPGFVGDAGRHFGITGFPKLGKWNYTTSASVISVLDTASYLLLEQLQFGHKFTSAKLSYQVKVFNNGKDTINEFVLNEGVPSSASYFCHYPYNKFTISTTLAPGASMNVSVAPHLRSWVMNYPNPGGGSITFNWLLYITVPNGKLNTGPAPFFYKWSPVFEVMETTFIEETENRTEHLVFPNPGDGLFTIKSSEQILGISVTDLFGLTLPIEDCKYSQNILDLRAYAPGIYFIRISSEKGHSVKKVLISH